MERSAIHWMIEPLRKYATFSGRSRRKEYWYFVLFYVILAVIVGTFDRGFGLRSLAYGGMGLAGGLISLVLLLPSLGVTVRRLHDLDRSGWWLLVGLIPIIGGIVMLVWMCSRGTDGGNRFGPDPLATDGLATDFA